VNLVKEFSKDDLLGSSGIFKQAQHWVCSGLVVGLIVHGLRNCIKDRENQLVSINDIIVDMDTPEMQGKPKILLILCCQSFPGSEDQHPKSAPNTPSLYEIADSRIPFYPLVVAHHQLVSPLPCI